MSKIEKIGKFLTDANYRLAVLEGRGFYSNKSDEEYIRLKWKAFFGGGDTLHLDNPKTLCEKLQWLKLYYRKPEFSTMVDKYEAKKYVAERVGEEHVIPTLGVWERVEDIDFNSLPDKFVLKPTHDSGGLIVCRDKSKLDIENAKAKLAGSLARNYYSGSREWPYKHVKPRIIAEPLVEELGLPDSIEYKTTCFNGKVAFVTICSGIAHAAYELRKNDHFDRNRNKLEWYVNYKPADVTPPIPEQWDELIEFCEALSADVPYLRVDTYIINGRILFGEMTFYTWGGFMHFEPKEWDLKLGEMLQLPEEKSILD